MEAIGAIFGLAVFLGFGWVLQKMTGAALSGVNRAVFRGEYAEGRHLREGREFRTRASVGDVMREIDTYVCAVDAALGRSDVLYVRERTERGVIWVYGHGSTVLLEALLALADDGGGLRAIFAVTRWQESDGLESSLEVLKALRMQVEAAFRAADPAVVVTEGTPEADELTAYRSAFQTAE